MQKLETKNNIACKSLIEIEHTVKYLKHHERLYVYHPDVQWLFYYTPDYKVLFKTDYMLLPIFRHDYDDYEHISEDEFLRLTKDDPNPKAYVADDTYFIVAENGKTAKFDMDKFAWFEDNYSLPQLATQIDLSTAIEQTENIQEKAYQKAKAEGNLPKFDLFK